MVEQENFFQDKVQDREMLPVLVHQPICGWGNMEMYKFIVKGKRTVSILKTDGFIENRWWSFVKDFLGA